MDAVSPMYTLKPFKGDDVPVPDVMYKLKSYHEAPEAGDIGSELVALEKRQDSILDQLKKLKAEVDSLVNSSSKPSGPEAKLWETQIVPCPAFKKGEVVEDIVITADASRPPLSVIILCSMLSQQYKLFTTCFAHSSIAGLKDDLKLALGESNGVVRNAADIAVSLIWKSGVSRPTLSTSSTTLEGEAAIARYLARLLKRPSSLYESDHLAAVTESDYYLDLYADVVYGKKADQAAAVEVLKKKLSSSMFLGGSKLSLADIVLWSGFVQIQSSVAIPAPVDAWMRRCNALKEFEAGKKLL